MDNERKLETIKSILDDIDEKDMTTAEFQILQVITGREGPVPKVCEENTAKIVFEL